MREGMSGQSRAVVMHHAFAPRTSHAESQRQWQRSSAAIGSHANMALLHANGDATRAGSGVAA